MSSLRIRSLAAGFAAVIALLGGCGGPSTPEGIVLITIDTCRADRIGCYGSEMCETPAIDALAEKGTLFLDATAPAPITLPSHCSILTGLYPDRHTVRNNGDHRLPEEAVTLAEVLEDAGWKTGAFIAAVPLERQFGTMQGFQTYEDDLLDAARGDGAGDPDRTRDVLTYLFSNQKKADQVVDGALAWLDAARAEKRPFLLWLHFFDPHHAYEAPARFDERYGSGSYEGEVAFVDEQIARLMDGLGGARDRVLVAVTADHGEALGDHGEGSHGFFVYQETMHVPWILKGPGIPSGQRVSAAVSLVQVMPTLLEAVGVAVPDGLDGRSALPLVVGTAGVEADPVYGETLVPALQFGWSGLRSVRKGRWKYIDAPRAELYDLRADPRETNNLADANPVVVTELQDELERHAARGGSLSSLEIELEEATRERLAGLGYVGGAGGTDAPNEDLFRKDAGDPKDMVGVLRDLSRFQQELLSGRTEGANEVLATLLERSPDNAALLRLVFDAQAQGRDWDGAARTARALTELAPDNVEAWRNLAVAEESRGQWPEVVAALSKVSAAQPGDARALVGLAGAHEHLGNASAARSAWERAVAADPGLSAAVMGLASVLKREGKDAKAVEILRAGLARSPDSADILNNLAWTLANGSTDPDEAYALAQRASAISPNDPVILDTLGWAAIRSGHAADAIAPLTDAWERTKDAEVRAHLGVALAESGDVERGRAHVEAAVQERATLRSVPEVARWLPGTGRDGAH